MSVRLDNLIPAVGGYPDRGAGLSPVGPAYFIAWQSVVYSAAKCVLIPRPSVRYWMLLAAPWSWFARSRQDYQSDIRRGYLQQRDHLRGD